VTIADTSGLLAFFNAQEPTHEAIRTIVENLTQPLVISPYVVAELDCLVATRLGTDAAVQVLGELASGAYDLASITDGDLRSCAEIINRYRDQDIGVTDASLVVLAERYQTTSILTLDQRHFSIIKPLTGGKHFILPDA